MKHYVITAKNKTTGETEHVATSDMPFKENPFGDISNLDFEYSEFDNEKGFVRAREVLDKLGNV